MTVTPDTIVVGPDRYERDISAITFTQILRDKRSPAVDSGAAGHAACAVYGVSAAFALALFWCESQFATDLGAVVVRYDTKNPGNCRSTRTGEGTVIQTDKGKFVEYETWIDGWEDMAFRLVDPSYVYVLEERTTIQQIVNRFAPKSDGNDPVAYAKKVCLLMNRWIGEAAPPTPRQLLDERYPLSIRISHIPVGNPNRPGGPIVPEGARWITVHETGNPRFGANAEMHRQFTHNGGGTDTVSFTWVVDDHEAIQLLPRDEKSWQASDGANGIGNSSESIETCVNNDGDWNVTKENLARLVARLIVEDEQNALHRVAQHNRWARDGKNCPTRMRRNGGVEWNGVLARTGAILTDVGYMIGPGPAPKTRPDPWGTRWWLADPFISNIRGHDWMLTGFAVSEMFIEDGLYCQYFERARLELHPNGEVMRGHVGKESLYARYPERRV